MKKREKTLFEIDWQTVDHGRRAVQIRHFACFSRVRQMLANTGRCASLTLLVVGGPRVEKLLGETIYISVSHIPQISNNTRT
jgi:hypothetical protein